MPNSGLACQQSTIVLEESKKNDIPPELLFSLIFYESRWSPKVKSPSGACGLTQVLPRYTKGTVGKHYSCKDLKDPATSIKVGAEILGMHYESSQKNEKAALCKYNRGPYSKSCKSWRATKHGIRYARKILKFSEAIREEVEDIYFCMIEDECCIDPYPQPRLFKY